MPTPTCCPRLVVINSDHPKGRKATDLFRAAYDKAELPEERSQRLNENPEFPAALLHLIRDFSTEKVTQESAILKPEDPITFPARDTPIDPNQFFNRAGIYLRGSFRERILPALKPVASTPERTYGVSRLKKNAHDREIRPALPKRHLASWEDIASLIEMYPNGTLGYFLFYMEGVNCEVFAVHVRWLSDYRRWYVVDWELDEVGRWRAGSQVLCPGNAAL